MPLSITHLPHDILLLISIKLSPKDILSFAQTCRCVYTVADSEYLWHHVHHSMPLDTTAVSGCNIKALSGPQVKRLVLDGLRLDDNWRKEDSRVRRIRKLVDGYSVMQMQPLGRQWLVTLAKTNRIRGHMTIFRISVWKLRDDDSRHTQVAAFETLCYSQIAASLQDSGNSMLLCFGDSSTGTYENPREHLVICDLDLRPCQRDSLHNPAAQVTRRRHLELPGSIGQLYISGAIMAATFFEASTGNNGPLTLGAPPTRRLVMVNTKTNATAVLELDPSGNYRIYKLELRMPCLVICDLIPGKGYTITARILPSAICSADVQPAEDKLGLSKIEPIHFRSLDLLFEYELEIPSSGPLDIHSKSQGEFQVSDNANTTAPGTFTEVLTRVPLSGYEPSKAFIFRVPWDPTSHKRPIFQRITPQHTIDLPPRISWDAASIGSTGYRAVWLQQPWDNDAQPGEMALMKGTFPYTPSSEDEDAEGQVSVVGLQKVGYPYPFEPSIVGNLVLQEAIGRVFISLHTGEIYVFDF